MSYHLFAESAYPSGYSVEVIDLRWWARFLDWFVNYVLKTGSISYCSISLSCGNDLWYHSCQAISTFVLRLDNTVGLERRDCYAGVTPGPPLKTLPRFIPQKWTFQMQSHVYLMTEVELCSFLVHNLSNPSCIRKLYSPVVRATN